MHKLIIEDDEGKTVVVPLIRDEITVGRQEGNTVRLTDQNISRRHARFIREGGVLYVEDLESYNGIKVNGTAIAAKTGLKDGDQIVIGDYKLGLKAEEGRTVGYGAGRPRAVSEVPAPVMAAATVPFGTPAAAASVAPTDMLEGAPTIPVRTLADQGLLRGEPQQAPSRLVVISTQLAGTEFLLDRASLVIGRTSENDIILNHKSISRHHAKVIRDGETYIVVDLESANGVRVNGAQQERGVLESGDVIELGHVRLKYLTGNDEVGALGVGAFRGSKKIVFMGAAAVTAVVVILLVAFVGGDNKKDAPLALAPEPAPAPALPAPEPPAAPPAPIVAPVPAAPSLAAAKQLVAQGQWDQGLAAIEQLPPALSNGPEGKALRKELAVERATEATLGRLQVEAEAGRLEPARKLAQAIPSDSRFAAKAAAFITKVEDGFVAANMKTAQALKNAGKCDDAKRVVDRILRVVPNAPGTTDLLTDCKKTTPEPPVVVAAAPQRRPVALRSPADEETPPALLPKAKAEPKEEEDAAPTGDPDQFIKDAQDAWLHGQFAAAIVASKKALRLRPGMARAYQIIAVCSCSLRDQNSAAKAYDRLDDKNRQMVRSLCEKNGIVLPE